MFPSLTTVAKTCVGSKLETIALGKCTYRSNKTRKVPVYQSLETKMH